jgi:hypothetical protein
MVMGKRDERKLTHQKRMLYTQLAVAIISVLSAAAASATLVVADFAVRLDELAVGPGALLVVGGLIVSFLGLSVGMIEVDSRDFRSTLLAMGCALLPAVLIGATRLQWFRVLLVVGMAAVGFAAGVALSRRYLAVSESNALLSRLRLAGAAALATLGTSIYVVAPSLGIAAK